MTGFTADRHTGEAPGGNRAPGASLVVIDPLCANCGCYHRPVQGGCPVRVSHRVTMQQRLTRAAKALRYIANDPLDDEWWSKDHRLRDWRCTHELEQIARLALREIGL